MTPDDRKSWHRRMRGVTTTIPNVYALPAEMKINNLDLYKKGKVKILIIFR